MSKFHDLIFNTPTLFISSQRTLGPSQFIPSPLCDKEVSLRHLQFASLAIIPPPSQFILFNYLFDIYSFYIYLTSVQNSNNVLKGINIVIIISVSNNNKTEKYMQFFIYT